MDASPPQTNWRPTRPTFTVKITGQAICLSSRPETDAWASFEQYNVKTTESIRGDCGNLRLPALNIRSSRAPKGRTARFDPFHLLNPDRRELRPSPRKASPRRKSHRMPTARATWSKDSAEDVQMLGQDIRFIAWASARSSRCAEPFFLSGSVSDCYRDFRWLSLPELTS